MRSQLLSLNASPEQPQWKSYGCKDYAQYRKRFAAVCEELNIPNDGQHMESIKDADLVDLYMRAVTDAI
ncbi:hypothetical protein LCGC14_0962840 [marine sediment metagenome]|uniref:Uncharacterized protein n=1 Tax=marine sediment metagenome TaxID=412755 RepID=A0A0F9QX58_9ZZZZ